MGTRKGEPGSFEVRCFATAGCAAAGSSRNGLPPEASATGCGLEASGGGWWRVRGIYQSFWGRVWRMRRAGRLPRSACREDAAGVFLGGFVGAFFGGGFWFFGFLGVGLIGGIGRIGLIGQIFFGVWAGVGGFFLVVLGAVSIRFWLGGEGFSFCGGGSVWVFALPGVFEEAGEVVAVSRAFWSWGRWRGCCRSGRGRLARG